MSARRAAIYARVSTREQSTDVQVDQLLGLCRARGWADPLIFRDDGISGVRDNRPQLDELRRRMLRGEVSAVVVTKMDRLGRSIGMILRFWDEADAAGVPVVVADQGIDTSTPGGRLQRNMLAAIAEFDRELILERTRAGIERAHNLRKKFGRPRTVPDSKRVSILRLASDGLPVPAIAHDVGVNPSTVRSILRAEGGRAKSPPHEITGSSPPDGPPPSKLDTLDE